MLNCYVACVLQASACEPLTTASISYVSDTASKLCCAVLCALQAGTHEPLIEKLPGPPDGVSAAPDGNFWVGLVSPIPPIAALLRDPTVRALYVWLPNWLKPPLKKWGAVTKVRDLCVRVCDRGIITLVTCHETLAMCCQTPCYQISVNCHPAL